MITSIAISYHYYHYCYIAYARLRTSLPIRSLMTPPWWSPSAAAAASPADPHLLLASLETVHGVHLHTMEPRADAAALQQTPQQLHLGCHGGPCGGPWGLQGLAGGGLVGSEDGRLMVSSSWFMVVSSWSMMVAMVMETKDDLWGMIMVIPIGQRQRSSQWLGCKLLHQRYSLENDAGSECMIGYRSTTIIG